MSKANPVRLRLVVAGDSPAQSQRRKLKRKARGTNPRALLLKLLREQQAQIGERKFVRSEAPELFDLAIAADNAPYGRKTFTFRGVRFRLKFGFRRYVLDPKSGATLTGGRAFA